MVCAAWREVLTVSALDILGAVVEAPGGRFALTRLRMDAPGPGQIRVKIHACGVCHTDMVLREGGLPSPFPCILGHEGAGVVEAIGAGVTSVAPGDHVLLSFDSCGACPACHAHQPGYCDEFVPRNFLSLPVDGQGGVSRNGEPIGNRIFGQSAFASHALVSCRNVVKLDPDLPLALMAPLGCGVQTGAGTVLETLKVGQGEAIAIFGAGAVGLSAVMAAKIAGAGRIAVLDRHANRLTLATELGATETATEMATLVGPFDHIVDTTGALPLAAGAIHLLASRGTLALVGAYPRGRETGVDLSAIMSMGRKVIGVVEGGIDPQQFLPRLVAYWRAGLLPIEKLVRTYAFADIEQAFHASECGEVIKPVLVMEPN